MQVYTYTILFELLSESQREINVTTLHISYDVALFIGENVLSKVWRSGLPVKCNNHLLYM